MSDVFVKLFNNIIIGITDFDLQASNPMKTWPIWAVLLFGFLARDFIQWWTHRLLHRSDLLWEFHKVHHSVEEMGFAAHLRFHWMETVVYRTIEYIPLALLGIGLYDFFIIHIFTLAVGHYNHSNISVSGHVTGGILGAGIGIIIVFGFFDVNVFTALSTGQQALLIVAAVAVGSLLFGPFMKKIFNHPEMHIWHHSYELPDDRRFGINFGLTLSMWDYIFGTAYIPHDGKEIKLGFPGIENFPDSFQGQSVLGFGKREFNATDYERINSSDHE